MDIHYISKCKPNETKQMKKFNQIQPQNRESLTSLKASIKNLYQRYVGDYSLKASKEIFKRAKSDTKCDARSYSYWVIVYKQLLKDVEGKEIIKQDTQKTEEIKLPSGLNKTEKEILIALNTEYRCKKVFSSHSFNMKKNNKITKTEYQLSITGWNQVKAARKLAKKGLIKFEDLSSIETRYVPGYGAIKEAESCGLVYPV